MTLTEALVARLESLKAGDRARLRQFAGRPLDHTLDGFDLFTGLWWPLRQRSLRAPERRSAWLVAKLYGAFPLPPIRGRPAALPAVLGRGEQRVRDERGKHRFRQRFDALLVSSLSGLEPHMRWALSVAQHQESGIDWSKLLDDLSRWDKDGRIQEQWAEQYLNPFLGKGEKHVD